MNNIFYTLIMTNSYQVLLLIIALVSSTSQINSKFSITKHFVEDKDATTVELGKVTIFEEGEINQAYVEPLQSTFVTTSDIANSKAVILSFIEENTNKVFKTAVTSMVPSSHSEKIIIQISSSGEIIGFNYVQTRLPNQDISIDFMSPDRGVEHVFKVEPQHKPVQEESFFQKYKWPLIIGGVIVYLSMSVDPEKQGQAAPQAR